MLMCYLCGREFGTRSLPIHVPQCEKKWLSQEAQKPLAEQRPLPVRPERLNAILMGVSLKEEERAVFNEEMYNNYDQDVLEKCAWCGRTFNPTAMKSHAKSCTQESPAKPAGTGLTKASLSNTITPGKVFGTRHVGSQNTHAAEMDLPGACSVPRRASSPMRAQSAKRLMSAREATVATAAATLPRSSSKGPKKAAPSHVTFGSPGPELQLPHPKKAPGCVPQQAGLMPRVPVVYKDASGIPLPATPQAPLAYPGARTPMVVYSHPGAATAVSTPPAAVGHATVQVAPATPGKTTVPSTTPVSVPTATVSPRGGKSFNFCSECGTKFQPSAKFCHECGVIRPGSEVCRLKYCHFCGARGGGNQRR